MSKRKVCPCRGTGRLSTYVIDGEEPEGWVTCPWCDARQNPSEPQTVTANGRPSDG